MTLLAKRRKENERVERRKQRARPLLLLLLLPNFTRLVDYSQVPPAPSFPDIPSKSKRGSRGWRRSHTSSLHLDGCWLLYVVRHLLNLARRGRRVRRADQLFDDEL